MPDPLISVEALQARLADGRTKLLDATWFMPDSGRDARAEFRANHLPGAVFFDIDAVADRSSPLPHMLPEADGFAAAMAGLGIAPHDPVVVYDRRPVPSAPRVWWTLRAFGHEAVEVLDGGLEAWAAAGLALEAGEPPITSVAYPPPRLRAERVTNFNATRAGLEQGAFQLVDARPAARFRGEAPEPRAGLRSGHAPGALNTPAGGFYDADGRFRSPAEVSDIFRQAGVDVGRPVVASCGSGVTAGVVALALARLGHAETALYDGSWAEWGGRADAPVVSGA